MEETIEYGTSHTHTPKPNYKHIWLWVTIGILALVILVSILVNFILGYALISKGITSTPTETKEAFYEKFVEGAGSNKVVLLPVKGLILAEGREGLFFSSEGTTEQIIARLKQAEEDAQVKAILLDVDSPGGEITASDIIHNRLLKFKKSGKKVIVLMEDLAASGAYYISAPADKIIAHPTTITGSIGVIMQSANIEGLFEKIGVKDVTIKSGPKKDMLSPTRTLTEEERMLLEGIIMEMHARFKRIVAEGRNLPPEKVDALADGRIYTGEQALSNGLVDKLGYREDAIDAVKEILGVKEIKIVEYQKFHTFMDFFKYMGNANTHPASILSLDSLRKIESPRLMYLWKVD
ncbi:MAG: signal peptide peptidase SppA [Candidatus Omnitrophica bacterium]|nr:signal peptide peptidase SppA [Candidatus Omnitrophota bacterium]